MMPATWRSSATIATGAWTGTHGITSFHVHLPGEPLGKQHWTFASGLCQAEYIWQAAERQGLRSILVNYPVAWPPTVENGIVVGGDGLVSHDWTVSRHVFYYTAETLARKEFGIPVKPARARSWKNLPESKRPPLEVPLYSRETARIGWSEAGSTFEASTASGPSRPDLYALIYATRKSAYNRVRICRSRDASTSLTDLRVGDWSPWLVHTLTAAGKKHRAAFRFKLLQLSRDASRLRLYRSIAGTPSGWAFPSGAEKPVIKNASPYVEGFELGAHAYRMGYFTAEEHPEQLELQCEDLARIANHLASTEDWNLLFVQVHAQDSPNHDFLGYLMPQHPSYSPELEARSWDVFRRNYVATDRLVAALVEGSADDNTLICLVSDHGACPTLTFAWTTGFLANAGLIAYERDSKADRFVIDWSRTKVFLTNNYIWVNTKGREPHGIVEPGREFDTVLDQAISVLSAVRDPRTGRCPVAFAARKEDAAFLGQWGDRVGDGVYYLNPGYSDYPLPGAAFKPQSRYADFHEVAVNAGFAQARHFTGLHHNYLPTARLGPASNRAILALSGPGIVRGLQQTRSVNLVDVTPTLCALMGISPPAQSEGRILTEALENPLTVSG